MFQTLYIPFNNNNDNNLRIFVDTENSEGYTLITDLASVIGIKSDSVRADISRHQLGNSIPVPALKEHLRKNKLIPESTGKLNFISSKTWLALLMRHFSLDLVSTARIALENALTVAPSPENTSVPDPTTPEGDAVPDEDQMDISDGEGPQDSIGSNSSDSSDSSDSSSDSESDSSSSSSSSDDDPDPLPVGVPDWVKTVPRIPSQFSARDYSKSYALKEYDIKKPLRKELKKLRKWWTKELNTERARKSAKAVNEATVFKREERVLCFLGFVTKYDCCPPDYQLTLGLVLNHQLFKSFLQYLKQVRECKPGTISESLTAAISVCKWLFRKERNVSEPSIIRRYMDWRNHYQAVAATSRAQDDKEELKEQNKWLEWTTFSKAIQDFRRDWDASDQTISSKTALKLHDLLLMGLYNCIPSRGCEVRLLQYLPEQLVCEQKGDKTFKRFVEAQEINLLTQRNGEWTMLLSQYKNVKFHGVDVTNLSKFQWWTDLVYAYFNDGYWDLLRNGKDHRFVFVTRSGDPFETGYFSDYISRRVESLTGVRVATNAIRSSFITYFYNSDASKDPMACESIASVLRHTTTEARLTYDRRNADERKNKGLEFIRNQQNQFGKRDHDAQDRNKVSKKKNRFDE